MRYTTRPRCQGGFHVRSFGPVAGVTLLFALAGIAQGDAAGPFETKLASDKQAVHVLNRLAYGPRPGDIEDVRRIGIEAWIRQQLNPAQIPENRALATKLTPLPTMQLATWELLEKYQPAQNAIRVAAPLTLTQLLNASQLQQVLNGSPEQKLAVLMSLTREVRRQVLAVAPRQLIEAAPELQQEAERARQMEAQMRTRELQEQQRKLRPPLNELLTSAQILDLQNGTTEKKMAVLTSLDKESRTKVFRTLNAATVPEAFKREALAVMNPQQAVLNELIEARLQRATYSTRQLEEVLVDFWMNHFNVFSGKGQVRMLLASYERDAIRPHVLGKFHDILVATARHPAMLFYLDNYLSQAPRDNNAPQPNVVNGGAVPRPGLNENYARELMELHTLGVNGGYTQKDVVEVARAFTGWTIFDPNRVGEFDFNPAMHDRGEKIVLGQTIPRAGGESDGLRVLEILARHPSTAQFIARKLAQRFVADDPPKPLVDRVAATFQKTNGDLRAVMETLLLSREFLSDGAFQAKTKSPLEMVVSSLRAFNAEMTDTTAVAQRLTELGQPLYGKSEPTGYPNTGELWTNSAGLLARMNFATALMAGQIAGVSVKTDTLPANDARRAFTQVTGVAPGADTIAAIGTSGSETPLPASALGTVIVASPDFQKR